MSSLKVYILNNGPSGPSCQTKYYGRYGKDIWQVVATSVKQAIYLAAHDMWWARGRPGIVSHTYNAAKEPWRHVNGEVKYGVPLLDGGRRGRKLRKDEEEWLPGE